MGFLDSGGSAGALLRSLNWDANPLGAPRAWPVPLKTLVGLMLAANQPMFIAWGPEQTLLYNDRYAEILAKRHPTALGRPFFNVWPEIRDEILPIMQRAYEGLPTSMDDIQLITQRNGKPEEAHFSFFYAPVRADDGSVGGMFCACSDTTDRVVTQRKVAAESARQRRLFDLAPGAIAVLHGPQDNFAFEFVNQSYRRLFDGRDLVGLPFAAAQPASFDAGFVNRLAGVYQTGQPHLVHDVPFEQPTPDGRGVRQQVDLLFEAIRDDAGKVTGVFVQGSDTSIAFTAKEGLRHGNERFKAAVDAVGVMWTATHDGRMVGEQAGWARLTGQTQLQYADMGWAEVIHPDEAKSTLEAWREAVELKKTFVFEHRIRTHEGKWRTHAVRAVPVLEPDGSVREWVGVHIDITEQREAQEALIELNRTLEQRVAERKAERDTMWQLSADLLVILGFDGTVRAASPASERILGLPPSDMVGRPMTDWVHPDDAAATRAAFERVMSGPVKLTNRWQAADGSYRTITWQASSEQSSVFAAGHDVTDELIAAEELDTAQAALRQAQKMESVGHLTGGIAHDFNNLLQGIGMSLQLIKRTSARPDQVERWVEKAMGSVERGAKLASQLLTFARLQQLTPQAVNVTVALESMTESLRKTIGPTLELVLDTQSTRRMAVTADAAQLEVAIVNLCMNARDAMPEGGTLTISTRQVVLAKERLGLQPGDYIEIIVADTGCGMAPDVLERAFDPFFSTKSVGRGSGLGLSQVYGFAHQLGGLASIESQVGIGTSVRLLLRQTEAQDVLPNDVVPDAVISAAELMLVDDDPDVLAPLKEMLLDSGYSVRAFESATKCLVALESKKADLLITDYAMPITNGAQLAKSVLEKYPELPIIVVTGYANASDLQDAVGSDATILRKPFKLADLVALIENKLAGIRARQTD